MNQASSLDGFRFTRRQQSLKQKSYVGEFPKWHITPPTGALLF